MKSFLIVLPFLGLAAAKAPCSQSTVTTTLIQRRTVTVPAVSSDAAPVSTPVEESSSEADATTVVYSTIFVTPSPMPHFPNSTFNASLPTTLSFVLASSSSLEADVTTAETARPSEPAETSEPGAIATSESLVAPSASASSNPSVGSEAAFGGSNSGEATFYGGNVAGGTCSFSGYTIPSGIFGTALSDANWASAGNCGACISITGPAGNSIKAMVVDQCPGCGNSHLDLFPDAFKALADPSKGVIPVSWSIVPCGITSPIVLKNKEGTSKYWFSMQVRNANVPVSKLEVSIDAGKTWKATTRKHYNFFENSSGFGTDKVDVKVTSTSGSTVTVKNVGMAAGSTVTAGSNFS